MKTITEKIEVNLKARNGKTTDGNVTVTQWSQPERLNRALKFGGMTWGLALISILLPIVHFVLVPSFLIAGPIVAYFSYRQKSIVNEGSGTCPYCGSVVSIGKGPNRWPIEELCVKCQNNINVERK
jgi:hypothetical protein